MLAFFPYFSASINSKHEILLKINRKTKWKKNCAINMHMKRTRKINRHKNFQFDWWWSASERVSLCAQMGRSRCASWIRFLSVSLRCVWVSVVLQCMEISKSLWISNVRTNLDFWTIYYVKCRFRSVKVWWRRISPKDFAVCMKNRKFEKKENRSFLTSQLRIWI